MIIETNGCWSEIRQIAQQHEATAGDQTVLSELDFASWLGVANWSQFSSGLNLLDCAETAPLGQSGGGVQLEN
jgi:hypothetical protein